MTPARKLSTGAWGESKGQPEVDLGTKRPRPQPEDRGTSSRGRVIHSLSHRLWMKACSPWSGDELLQLSQELTLTLGADEALLGGAVLEDDQGGDAHHVEATRHVGVVVDVELGDGDLAGVLAGDLVEDGGDHLARPAPLRPEVDDDRLVGRCDGLVEGGVREGRDAFSHVVFFLSNGTVKPERPERPASSRRSVRPLSRCPAPPASARRRGPPCTPNPRR